jgi:membrane protein implicated in regulation of membrane protease activity
MADSKPYHLMTPAERLAHRIEQNRKIEEKVQKSAPAVHASKTKGRASAKGQDSRPEASANQPSGSGTRVEVTQSFSIRKMGRS